MKVLLEYGAARRASFYQDVECNPLLEAVRSNSAECVQLIADQQPNEACGCLNCMQICKTRKENFQRICVMKFEESHGTLTGEVRTDEFQYSWRSMFKPEYLYYGYRRRHLAFYKPDFSRQFYRFHRGKSVWVDKFIHPGDTDRIMHVKSSARLQLISQPADLCKGRYHYIFREEQRKGKTPLYIAARQGYIGVAVSLLHHGCDARSIGDYELK